MTEHAPPPAQQHEPQAAAPPSTAGALTHAGSGSEARDVAENKWIATIAYLGPLVLVALLLGRESPYARFHLNQGLVFAITWIVLWVVGLMLDFFLAFIPVIGWILGACIPLTLFVGWVILAITGVLNAVNGRTLPLPGIGKAFRVLS